MAAKAYWPQPQHGLSQHFYPQLSPVHKHVPVVALPATVLLCQPDAVALTLPGLQDGFFQLLYPLILAQESLVPRGKDIVRRVLIHQT